MHYGPNYTEASKRNYEGEAFNQFIEDLNHDYYSRQFQPQWATQVSETRPTAANPQYLQVQQKESLSIASKSHHTSQSTLSQQNRQQTRHNFPYSRSQPDLLL